MVQQRQDSSLPNSTLVPLFTLLSAVTDINDRQS